MDRINQGGIMKSDRAFIGVDFVVDFVDGKGFEYKKFSSRVA